MTPIERAILTLGATVVLFGLGHVARLLWQRRVTARLRTGNDRRPVRFHGPALLYFHTDGCAPCRTQELHIREVQRTLAASGQTLRVVPYDALVETQIVRELRVVTVPTTVVIGRHDEVVGWNPGLTGARKLLEQVRPLIGQPPVPEAPRAHVTLGARRSPATQLQ